MKISKAVYTGPDSDNELSFEIEGAIENDSESAVELIKTSALLINSAGVGVTGSANDEVDVFIDPGETTNVDINVGWGQPAYGFSENMDDIRCVVDAQLYRREFHILGTFDVPAEPGAAFINKGLDIAGMVKLLGATLTRSKPDENDSDIRIEASVCVRNVSDIYFDRITAKLVVYDQEGAEVDTFEDYHYLAPRSGHILNPSSWSLKAGRLRNAKAKLTIHIFQPVAYQTETFTFKKEA